MTQLKSGSLKEIFLGDIKDPAVQEAIKLLQRNVQAFANQASISVNANEPLSIVWTAPALTNAWVNYGGAYQTARFGIDQFKVVHIEGFVKDGVIGSAVFTLPVGFRPVNHQQFATVSNSLFGAIQVSNTGDVVVFVGTNPASLSGITFSVN